MQPRTPVFRAPKTVRIKIKKKTVNKALFGKNNQKFWLHKCRIKYFFNVGAPLMTLAPAELKGYPA